MRLRSSPGVWLHAARQRHGDSGRRERRVTWPPLRFPPVNLLNAPPSPWMLREQRGERQDWEGAP